MGIKKTVTEIKNLPQKMKENLADSARLSQNQIDSISQKRSNYLSSQGIAKNDSVKLLQKNLSAIGVEVFRTYLPKLSTLYTPLSGADKLMSEDNRVEFFDITKWVTNTEENTIEKLMNVYQVLSGEDCSIALVFTRNSSLCRVTMAVSNNTCSSQPVIVQGLGERIRGALSGNFPGVECSKPTQKRIPLKGKVVASISNLPSEKSEKFISQSMEKLLDGIVPVSEKQEYSLVLLANPVNDCAPYIQQLHDQYTAISPFATVQSSFSLNESSSLMANVNAGGSAGINGGLGGEGWSIGANVGFQLGRSYGENVTIGTTEGKTMTYVNYAVQHTQKLIESQMKRLEQCQALGMWNFATYVISSDYTIAQNVAHMYVSLTQGEESYLEQSAINVWKDDVTVSYMLNAISSLHHPNFCLKEDVAEEFLTYPALVDATTVVSGKELAQGLNFPKNSVPGLPVIQCTAFGRTVLPRDAKTYGDVALGCISHMQKDETAVKVKLNSKSLTAHTFITGSTGSGKSNTVYKLLHELCFAGESDKSFLVIEPAKGEYKQVFGGREEKDVSVYGTNFWMAPLLRINPFSFPDNIHVLEHIDRLIEIFNACWPMYAAMPAVMKDAIEESYKSCGWNLTHSVCSNVPVQYPTFETLLKKLPEIMDSSAYSKDTKGDYTGALVTRVKSLTNGINGQIFCSGEELSNKELFDQNVIVDLSRVGSMETKSLLMGILMIKLQEHRIAVADETGETNADLRHITVLEEAHNLLRRTSSEQSQDSSNLQGKSVEMLANAIAEMRTYGEGFIIADQAPGLLDMAVIRNTNTKIIMRLPDESDRVLVGKAAGLTDDQIVELSKLDTGVAAVFQNHWLEAVLCKVDEFTEKHKYNPQIPQTGKAALHAGVKPMNFFFEKLLGKPTQTELSNEEVDKIRTWINKLNVQGNTKARLRTVLEGTEKPPEIEKRDLLFRVVNGNDFIKYAGMYVGSASAREKCMHDIDQKIIAMLEVSEIIAAEIRRNVFLYAADRVKAESQRNELRYYGEETGGVK